MEEDSEEDLGDDSEYALEEYLKEDLEGGFRIAFRGEFRLRLGILYLGKGWGDDLADDLKGDFGVGLRGRFARGFRI